ncbi:MAG: hypothetical protein GY810_24235 [Aureispira sp.]|nr:hypothetical protein [Aureispira sp.]
MKNNHLVQVLSTLSRKEIRLFRQWLQSPLHNTNVELLRLYDYFIEDAQLKEQYLAQDLIWSTLYPNKPLDKNYFRQINHLLLKNLEEFLGYQLYKRTVHQEPLFMAHALHKRHLDKLLDKRLNSMERKLTNSLLKDAAYLSDDYQYKVLKFRFSERKKRTAPTHIQSVSNTLDIYYCAEKLKTACLFMSHNAVYKADYSPNLLDEVLGLVEQNIWIDIPAVGIYYYCYKALYGDNNNDFYFEHFTQHLYKYKDFFTHPELRELYLLGINYIIRKINTGKLDYVRQAFELYKAGVEYGYLMEHNQLSPWTYRNTVIVGCKLKEFEWLEHFIPTYQKYLDAKHRRRMYNECLARLYYTQKQYDQAIELLQQTMFKDILQNLNNKTMLAKMYYETELKEPLDSLLTSMRVFIHRKKVLSYHEQNYSNFAQLLQRLTKLNPFASRAKDELLEAIQTTQPLTEREWFLEQLNAPS